MRSSRCRRLLARLVLVLGGSLFALALAELSLRILGASNSPQGVFFVPDPVAGWANRPGATGVWTYEGHARVSINREGQRDVEHSIAKQPGSVRIAVLGDSFAAAFQVAQSDDFCSVLERRLSDCLALHGRKPEVINFGVNAYGTAQELVTLRDRVWKYSPDVVIVAFYPNDLYDNSEDLRKAYPAYTQAGRPYFHYSGGQLVLDDSFAHSAAFESGMEASKDPGVAFGSGFHRLLWRFRIWQLVSRLRAGSKVNLEEPFAASILNPPADARWNAAWRITEGLLSAINAECARHGARFLLAIVSYSFQVYPGAQARAELLKNIGVSDPTYLNRRLEELGRRDGFPVVSLAEPMRQLADEKGIYFHGFSNTAMGHGHWNEQGHRLAGELMASAVCRLFDEHSIAVPSPVNIHGL